jgi:hypothetical protein
LAKVVGVAALLVVVATVVAAAPGRTTARSARLAGASGAGAPTAAPAAATAAAVGGEAIVAPAACATILGCDDDLAAALDLESRINDHLWYGHVLEIDYATPDRTPGDVASIGAWGDSGLWTGAYLAAEAFRYAVAKDALADPALAPAELEAWQAQLTEAKARIDTMVATYHRSVNIAGAWQTTFEPTVDANAADPSVRYGGGIVQGEPGMLMRSCAPADAPPGRNMAPNKRVFGPFLWEDGKEYVCETAPSRDTYAGTTFGLLTAFDLVGPDDAAMQALIGEDIVTMADFLVRHGWSYPRPHGNLNIPVGEQKLGGTKVPMTGHDFDGVASPLFVYVPMARLNMAQAARHVSQLVGTADQAAQWEAVWREELASQGPALAASMEVDSAEPNNGYYKYNLHHLTGFSTVRLEQEPAVKTLLMQALGVMDHTTGDDINAHFEAITYALTGEQPRLDAAVAHLREWRAYRALIETGALVDNLSKCGVALACVPDDQWDAAVGPDDDVEVTTKPGTSTKLRASLPLPVADRAPSDFIWQRPPTQLNGQDSPTHEAPGVDYLLPYWLIRYLTEVAPPAAAPFPAWPGPAHR